MPSAPVKHQIARIAQISDLHVQTPGTLAYGVVDTNSLVKTAIAHLNQLSPQPDVVVASGDLVQQGTLANYRHLRAILTTLRAPIYLMPGNHDHQENLRQVFADHLYLPGSTDHLSYVVDDYPIRLIMLDNTLPDKNGGGLDSDQRFNNCPLDVSDIQGADWVFNGYVAGQVASAGQDVRAEPESSTGGGAS